LAESNCKPKLTLRFVTKSRLKYPAVYVFNYHVRSFSHSAPTEWSFLANNISIFITASFIYTKELPKNINEVENQWL